jgi:hypothetical protein
MILYEVLLTGSFRYLAGVSQVVFFLCSAAQGATLITAQAGGGNIPDASCATPEPSGNCSVPTTITSDIFFNLPGFTVAPGDSVAVTLLGFQYIWAGDLTVTLTYLPKSISVDLFSRLGVIDPTTDAGFGATFGGGTTNGGNYAFDSLSTNDLWLTAASTANGDSIPEGTYFPVTSDDVPSTPSFDTAFTGQNISGTWELAVSNYDPSGNALAGFTGFNNFTGWELDIVTDAPEPSYSIIFLMLGAGAIGVKRWKRLA